MSETIRVHGAPADYILAQGVLQTLEDRLIERGIENVLIVHGEKSWQATKPYWTEFTHVQNEKHQYKGECSLSEIAIIAQKLSESGFDAVIGVGGGKVLDLVKSAGRTAQVPAILIPTLASNCSPWTPVSVIYDDEGTFIRFDIYPEPASLVLIEPAILLQAPVEILIAGIGDTLAKWYEADVQMNSIKNKTVPLQISYYAAKQCKDVLLRYAEGAVAAVKSRTLNDDFIKITETIIMLGGMVGGYGDHYGRIAGAHSIHNGLTAVKDTHHELHGNKVAYGILVQLVLENKWAEIESLLPFYQKLGLPISIVDLGVKNVNQELIEAIGEKAAAHGESIHVMPIEEITGETISKAIADLELWLEKSYLRTY